MGYRYTNFHNNLYYYRPEEKESGNPDCQCLVFFLESGFISSVDGVGDSREFFSGERDRKKER